MSESTPDRVRIDELVSERLPARVVIDLEKLKVLEDGDTWILGLRGEIHVSKRSVAVALARVRGLLWALASFALGWLAAHGKITW